MDLVDLLVLVIAWFDWVLLGIWRLVVVVCCYGKVLILMLCVLWLMIVVCDGWFG